MELQRDGIRRSEIDGPVDGPRTLTEFEILINFHPELIRSHYSDSDLRALLPSQELAELIIEIADKHSGSPNAA